MNIYHSIRMIVTELVVLSILTIVHTIRGRCYLCSQETLAECIGSNQLNSSIYENVLQYYTEPCNGQCILFRNENHSIIRGCSWTYGHMRRKSIGWHEITPGIKAYFCDSHLCNNGTYEQPEISQLIVSSTTNNVFGGYLSHQCYSCTARFQGCGEFLDPHYASKYIRPCPSSCIIFRNPYDLNLITRDCGIYWSSGYIKTGLHKLFGFDAFFCQESLCNGISFDFLMSIFRNQLPTIISFRPIENTLPTTTDIYNDNAIWDDPDLDDDLIETTTLMISSSSITTDYNFNDKILSNNNTTIANFSFKHENSSDLNDTSLLFSSTVISSTIQIEEILNTSSIPSITSFEQFSPNETDENIDRNDYQLFEYINPLPSLVIPPFSWMLNLANQYRNSTIKTTTKSSDIFYEYCQNKQCHHHGHLNSDCLCICLPTFTGENCETVLCEEEPPHICVFILEHECQTNYIQYLCPKFCQLDICT